jgi:hypothetical protein
VGWDFRSRRRQNIRIFRAAPVERSVLCRRILG